MTKKKNKPGPSRVIGIDLGTTNSVAATYGEDGKARIIPNGDGVPLTPSVVSLADETNPVVGQAAVNQRAYQPETTVDLFKRAMGVRDADDQPLPYFVHPTSGRAYTPHELSSLVLTQIKRDVETALGAPVHDVVITVPAYFDDAGRMATRRAGEMAGFNVLSVINEPTAAALAFGIDKDAAGTIAVFDLGGGTFDISILKIAEGDYKVLATNGDRELGGSNMTDLLTENAVAAFEAEHGIRITPERDLVGWCQLKEQTEGAKRTLSQATSTKMLISSEGKRLIFEVDRDEFNTLIAPLLTRMTEITQEALTAAGCSAQDIDDVILVGGATRVTAVRQAVEKIFGNAPRQDINPDEAVAQGAAIYSARYAKDAGLQVVDSSGKPVLPPAMKLQEVNAHALGCLAKVNGELRNCVIIPANTPLPATMHERFALEQIGQTDAKFELMQGPHHALPSECSKLGEYELNDLPPTDDNRDRIMVEYVLTSEGVLTLTATDEVSGKKTTHIKRGLDGLVDHQNRK